MKFVSKSLWLVVLALSLLLSSYPLHDVKATPSNELRVTTKT